MGKVTITFALKDTELGNPSSEEDRVCFLIRLLMVSAAIRLPVGEKQTGGPGNHPSNPTGTTLSLLSGPHLPLSHPCQRWEWENETQCWKGEARSALEELGKGGCRNGGVRRGPTSKESMLSKCFNILAAS